MNVPVPVVIAAAMVVTAEHRAWPSRHRAYAGADHRPDRPADRRAGGGTLLKSAAAYQHLENHVVKPLYAKIKGDAKFGQAAQAALASNGYLKAK